MELHPWTTTSCRQSWHSIISTLQVLMRLLSLFRCFFISQTFLERKKRQQNSRSTLGIINFLCVLI